VGRRGRGRGCGGGGGLWGLGRSVKEGRVRGGDGCVGEVRW